MIRKLYRKHPYLYYLLVATSLVFLWRGVWGLLDIYLFAKDNTISFWVSTAIGLILLFVTHAWSKRSE